MAPRNHVHSHSGVIPYRPFAGLWCSIGLFKKSDAAKFCMPWGPFMKDLVIELILIAMIVVPLVADSRKPCRVTNRLASGPRRTH